MSAQIGAFQQGETIRLAVFRDAVSSTALTGAEPVTAAIAPALRVGVPPSAAAPRTALAAAWNPALGPDNEPGWELTLDAVSSAALAEGVWAVDARIDLGGGLIVRTDMAWIAIAGAVTP